MIEFFFSRSYNIVQELNKCNYQLLLLVNNSRFLFFFSGRISFVLGGILSLLDENTEKGPVYALHRLNAIVDVFWPEISDSISKVYVIENKTSFLIFISSFLVNHFMKMKILNIENWLHSFHRKFIII
jgi:hypothetical protein